MTSYKETFLILILFLLVICLGIGYFDKVHKCNELGEITSMEKVLIVDGLEIESNISKEELSMKLCEEEIQEKRNYIDKCISNNELQKKNIPELTDKEEHRESPEDTPLIQLIDGLQQILKFGQVKLDECYQERITLKSTYKDCYHKDTVSREDTSIFRNGSSVNKIKNFIVFLGYPRSGGSIVGAVLDAHPHVVLSNEFNPVMRWTKSERGTIAKFNRFELFRNIKNAAWSDLHNNGGTRSKTFNWKYYTLDIPGLFQGEYKDYIQIIGDKQDNHLVDYDTGNDDSKSFIQLLERFKDFVGYQVKFFHTVRNPYDNIATVLLYRLSSRNQVIKSGKTINRPDILVSVIKQQFVLYEKIQRYLEYFGDRVLTLYHEDLISNPTIYIQRMCNHMEIYCGEDYVEKVSKSVFSKATESRHSVVWNQDAKTKVESAIQKYSFLNRYKF
ncbi:hypothetical protein LOD99_10063 [Oopsacas minuta]|uniref:Protein-tyrosine sulfotransferase n=1 Tax=Oopsacas minuta TaxID=111878 RepID=A0AAV7KKB9_9METZ|nr:hypothetical protein LOD99_10063 [Oopsacas minuta]